MPTVPKPSTSVASLIAILVMLQVGGFIYGVGTGHLTFTDTQFGLISGYILGAGTTILAYLYGSSKQGERAAELAAQPPAPPPGTVVTTTTAPAEAAARPVWTPEQRAAMTGKSRAA